MPYIKQKRRTALAACRLDAFEMIGHMAQSPGELNYILTSIILDYFQRFQWVNYAAYNEVIGVLECVKLEIARRMLYPYEDKQCEKNGDVF